MAANTQDYKDTKDGVKFDDKDIKCIEIPIDSDLCEQIIHGIELQIKEPQVTDDSVPKERNETSVEEFDLKEPIYDGGK